jgi:hypothetical protein
MPKTPIFPISGIDRNNSIYLKPDNKVVQLDNWFIGRDENEDQINSYLVKFPLPTAYRAAVSTTNCRGMFAYIKSNGFATIIQARSDGKIYYDAGTWTQLAASLQDVPFEMLSHYDLAVMANGVNYTQKWDGVWSTTRKLQNKSDTTALSGTLTFTKDSTAVTGAATAFNTELEAGQYIKKDNTTATYWYQVESVTSAGALVLSETFKETTGAGASGGSLKSNPAVRGRHLCVDGGGSLLIGNIIYESVDAINETSDTYLLLDGSQLTADSEFLLGTGSQTAKGVAQSYTTGAYSTAIGKVIFKMRRSGGTEGNMVCEIRTALGSGSILGTSTVAVSELSTSAAEVEFDFSAIAVTASTQYFLCVRQDTDTTATSVYVAYNSAGGLASESMYYSLDKTDWGTGYSGAKTWTRMVTADTYIYESDVNHNYGNSLYAYASFPVSPYTHTSLFKSSLLINQEISITSMFLNLRITAVSHGTDATVIAARVLRDWGELTATWNNYDGVNGWTTAGGASDGNDFTSTDAATITSGENSGWRAFDVTNIGKGWISGLYSNCGLIVTVSAGTQQDFPTRENSNFNPYFSITLPGGANLAPYDLYFKVYATGTTIDNYAQIIKTGATVTRISKVELYGEVLVSSATIRLDILGTGSSLPVEATVISQITGTFAPQADGWLAFIPDVPIDVASATTYAIRPRFISGGAVLLKFNSTSAYADGTKCVKTATWAAQTQDFHFRVTAASADSGNKVIAVSDETDGEDFPYTNITVPLSKNDQLTAIAALPDGFVAFGEKGYHIYKRLVIEPYFARVRSYEGVGCKSAGLIAQRGDGTFYFADDNDRYIFTGTGHQAINADLDADSGKMFGRKSNESYYSTNQNSMPGGVFFKDRKWYIFSCSFDENNNKYIYGYDEQLGAYFRATGDVGYYATNIISYAPAGQDEVIYLGSCNSDGLVNYLDMTNYTLTAGTIKTKRMTFGDYWMNKKIKSINWILRLKAGCSATLTASILGDRDTTASTYPITVASATAKTERYKMMVQKSARDFEFTFTDAMSVAGFGIIYAEVDWEPVNKEE